MNESDKRWLACAIDTEGSIYLMRHGHSKTGITVRVVVTNTHMGFLEGVRQIAQTGTIRLTVPPRMGKRGYLTKACYVWGTQGRRACSLIRELLPYLIIKREKALRAIQEYKPLGKVELAARMHRTPLGKFAPTEIRQETPEGR